jgi:putative intracellular protease/amidase
MIIAIGLYQGFTALDAIGPYEVLTYLPGAEMVIWAEQKGVIDDHNDLVHLQVDATFAAGCLADCPPPPTGVPTATLPPTAPSQPNSAWSRPGES